MKFSVFKDRMSIDLDAIIEKMDFDWFVQKVTRLAVLEVTKELKRGSG